MNRYTVTHPDGIKSTRNSKTRVYTHAVVVTTDEHQRAAGLIRSADAEQDTANRYRAQSDADLIVTEDPNWVGGRTYRTYSLPWPGPVGKPLYLGREVVEADGTISGVGGPFDRDQALADAIATHEQRAQAYRDNAAELLDGPQITYGVWRWSGDAGNAEKYAATLRGQGLIARVVPVDQH